MCPSREATPRVAWKDFSHPHISVNSSLLNKAILNKHTNFGFALQIQIWDKFLSLMLVAGLNI